MEYRTATPANDDVLISQYLAIWESYGVEADAFAPDARELVAKFIAEGRLLLKTSWRYLVQHPSRCSAQLSHPARDPNCPHRNVNG
jgi:hypothetical protein